jgi:hypothetical protein
MLENIKNQKVVSKEEFIELCKSYLKKVFCTVERNGEVYACLTVATDNYPNMNIKQSQHLKYPLHSYSDVKDIIETCTKFILIDCR